MYRENLDGIVERVRRLEEEKTQLEADVGRLRRIRWPQRVLRIAVSSLALCVAAGFGGTFGYWHAVAKLHDVARADARLARERLRECTGALTYERSERESLALDHDVNSSSTPKDR
jgi:hypothetical protein